MAYTLGASVTYSDIVLLYMRHASPNIILIIAGNLGWGELGCYGGGVLCGAPTPNIDRLASQGLRLLNFNVEYDRAPTRAALMSGRHPVRTGCVHVVPQGLPVGLNRNEITLAQLLAGRGYATAHFGHWYLGDIPGRLPIDRGFDEWYGIAGQAAEQAHAQASIMAAPHILRGRKGKPSHSVKPYTRHAHRWLQASVVERSIDFIRREQARGQPFFLYASLAHLGISALPHPDFEGRSGVGDVADCRMELDHRVGQIVDAVDSLGMAQDTVIVFCSDSGPEYRLPHRGTAGPWSGSYRTALEGGLRVPFIARWPGRIAPSQCSNEIVHVTDLFTTLASMGGVLPPGDRPIDGRDQTAFLTGAAQRSARDGFLHYAGNALRAVKWRDWKLHFNWKPKPEADAAELASPYLFNLLSDPKEESDVLMFNTWIMSPMLRMISAFGDTVRQHPHTVPGAPDVDSIAALLQR